MFHRLTKTACFIAVFVFVLSAFAFAESKAVDATQKQNSASWHSQSLTMDTVTGPNGAITTQTQLNANSLWGLTSTTLAEKVDEGIYALRGWGIASSYAIETPNGWIIIDTGDSTRAAAEMRAKLEEALGKKIKVAAILLTHWHYADGISAWMDNGTELWGHELLDSNRNASTGVSVMSGFYQTRAVAQFAVFHPDQGPDAFPSLMRFFPEKLLAKSSYQKPTKLFQDGKVLDIIVAGEPVQVAPGRTDTSCSVSFYFPRHRLVITNMMVTGAIFNVYTLRGGPYRNPQIFINDARWVESKNANILLDIHGPTLKGEKEVKEAIERSVDQVQLIHDQTLRLMSHGKGAREAAEEIYMPAHLRESREAYGQVESHVRQVYNGVVGWFEGDVYEINPLSLNEEATRTIEMMGGVKAVQKAAEEAVKKGGLDNWRWALKLTSLLQEIDPKDAKTISIRADASRALGQRTTSANARGFYITEALQLEGKYKVDGISMNLDMIRAFVGTPTLYQLESASVDENLQFLRYLVDPYKAEGKKLSFTLSVKGDSQIRLINLRNGVLVVSNVDKKGSSHIEMTKNDLANFVLEQNINAKSADLLLQLNKVLDRSHLMLATNAPAELVEQKNLQQ